MLPLSDGLPARRFPVVNILLIVANFAVFILYELPNMNSAVYHASFYPCTVDNACRGPEPWGVSWITAMFLHGVAPRDPPLATPETQDPEAEMRIGLVSGRIKIVINLSALIKDIIWMDAEYRSAAAAADWLGREPWPLMC